MDLISINEIDNVRSTRSPHAEELKKFGKEWSDLFREFGQEDLDNVSHLIHGKVDELELDEEWALTKEFFPEVRTHVSYHYHGEEFSNYGEEDMLRFLFSGERVTDVTGEDLAGMIDVMLNFIGRHISGTVLNGGEKRRKLQEKYLKPRKEAIDFLNMDRDKDMKKLAKFLGGQFEPQRSKKVLKKEFFRDVIVRIDIVDGDLEDLYLQGETGQMADYEQDSLIIYTLNHIIRFIVQKYPDRDFPEFCNKVFPEQRAV